MLSSILKGKDSNVYVKQSLLLNGLDLTVDEKIILTRTIKECFPMENKLYLNKLSHSFLLQQS